MVTIKDIILIVYGLFLSAVIGLIAAAFLITEGFFSDIVWVSNNQILQIILIIIGSGILYYLLKRWPSLPKTAHDSITELKQNQTINYQDVFLNLLITLVILTFGAGVGPEAALLSAIISLSIWQADNLRYLYFQYDVLKQLPFHKALGRLLNPFRYRQKYDDSIAPKMPQILRKKILYAVFTINGIWAFALLLRQTDQPSFILKLGQSHWQLTQLWLLPVLMIAGYIFAILCKVCYNFFYRIFHRWQLSLLQKVILGAVGIILVSYLAPDLLFSGQHSLHLLIGSWSHKSAGFLTVMALLKLVFLAWCLNLNWRGGDIFPITFAAMTEGFAAASLLPNYDALFVTAIIATTIMSELASPIVAGIFLLFFFPIILSPVIIVIAVLMFLKNKYLPKLNVKLD
ncbi:chloride channel protein [Companilactobacillus kimchiensis]|uniref:Chloride channel protein n=1 Tax=Companilactobacillus kimchiensis TaxID=993692 RepID=A0A0R2LA07_9LACO|nr:chloride channel protein [Companilactobacillus kimchiensis]KRN98681.1 hypothetical protein IV57_GL000866 [Companilactobacillus kimchiensis]